MAPRDRHDDDENKDEDSNHAEAAGGVVRGAARSLGRTVLRPALKAPVGSLPHRAVFRQRLPLKQVAKVSDRLSTGYDWWSTAVESTPGGDGKKNQVWPRVKSFTSMLMKNALLGAAVFESYGYIVDQLAPATIGDTKQEDDEGFLEEPDEFERASLPIHIGAGFAAGSVHGVFTTVLESSKTPVRLNAIHHACAHSILFGSYEGLKRLFVGEMHSMESGTQIYGGGYLVAFGIAGGIAGQLQHLSSHYLELWLGISSWVVPKDAGALARIRSTAPAVRPTMAAFLPSCIGFIAFEYGKKFSE